MDAGYYNCNNIVAVNTDTAARASSAQAQAQADSHSKTTKNTHHVSTLAPAGVGGAIDCNTNRKDGKDCILLLRVDGKRNSAATARSFTIQELPRDPASMNGSFSSPPSNQFTTTAAPKPKESDDFEPLPFTKSPDMTYVRDCFHPQFHLLPQSSEISPKTNQRRRHTHTEPVLVLPPTLVGQNYNTTSTVSTSKKSSASKHGKAWDRKINDLVRLFTLQCLV